MRSAERPFANYFDQMRHDHPRITTAAERLKYMHRDIITPEDSSYPVIETKFNLLEQLCSRLAASLHVPADQQDKIKYLIDIGGKVFAIYYSKRTEQTDEIGPQKPYYTKIAIEYIHTEKKSEAKQKSQNNQQNESVNTSYAYIIQRNAVDDTIHYQNYIKVKADKTYPWGDFKEFKASRYALVEAEVIDLLHHEPKKIGAQYYNGKKAQKPVRFLPYTDVMRKIVSESN